MNIDIVEMTAGALVAAVGYKNVVVLPSLLTPGCRQMPYHARLAQRPDADFITNWHAAGTTEEVVEQVVARVGRVPRWAVVARAVALRKAGNIVKPHASATSSSAPAA